MSSRDICLLLGATGVGKTLLLKRLQKHNLHGLGELGTPPSTLPTVGTNLTDLTLKKKKVTLRELGGCMGPIWSSYFKDCSSVIFMVDSANIAQIASSCIQLLSVLSAEPLRSVSVLILFNKRDMPCTMSLTEIKSLFRMDDIIASATQPITTLELSAHSGQGLQEVLSWLESITVNGGTFSQGAFRECGELWKQYFLKGGRSDVLGGCFGEFTPQINDKTS